MKKLLVILFILLFYNISYWDDNSEKVTYWVVSYSSIFENPNSKYENELRKYILSFKSHQFKIHGKVDKSYFWPVNYKVYLNSSQKEIIETKIKSNDDILIWITYNTNDYDTANKQFNYYLKYFDKIVDNWFTFKSYKKEELLKIIDENNWDIEIIPKDNYSYFLNKEDSKKYIENLLINWECILSANNETKKNTSISSQLLLSNQESCTELVALYYTWEKWIIGLKLYTDSYREKLNISNDDNTKKHIENVIYYQYKWDKLYYIWYNKEQSKYYVSLNWEKKIYDEVWSLNISDNWRNYSYFVNKWDKSYIVIGWEDIPNQEIQIDWYIVETKISPDWKNIFHIVQIWNEYVKIFKNWKEILKVPNSRQTDDQSVINSSFAFLSNNSYVFIYKKNWNFYLSKDSKDIWNYSLVYNTKKIITKWNNYIFKAKKNWKEFVVYNWVEQKKYDYVWDPIFSENNSYLYLAKSSWKSFVVVNQIEWKKYDEIVYNENYNYDNPKFLNNSAIYIAKNNWKYFIVIDKTEQKEYEYVSSLKISKNWLNYVYIVNEGWKNFAIFNWKNWKEFDKLYVIDYWTDVGSSPMLDLSLNWDSVWYIATDDFNSKDDKKWFVRKDNIDSNKYYNFFQFKYLNNWDLISVFQKDKVLINEKKLLNYCILTNLSEKCYDNITFNQAKNDREKILFSPDWNNYVFISQNKVISTNFWIWNNYESILWLEYSSDWKDFYYIWKESNWKINIVKNNKLIDVISWNWYSNFSINLINNNISVLIDWILFKYDVWDDKYLKTLKGKLISSNKWSIVNVIDKYVSKTSKINLTLLKEKLLKVKKTDKNRDIIEYFEASIDNKLSQ